MQFRRLVVSEPSEQQQSGPLPDDIMAEKDNRVCDRANPASPAKSRTVCQSKNRISQREILADRVCEFCRLDVRILEPRNQCNDADLRRIEDPSPHQLRARKKISLKQIETHRLAGNELRVGLDLFSN